MLRIEKTIESGIRVEEAEKMTDAYSRDTRSNTLLLTEKKKVISQR